MSYLLAQASIGAVCALACEYDMQPLLDSAEEWLVDAAARGVVLAALPQPPGSPASHPFPHANSGAPACTPQEVAEAAMRFARTLSLARAFKLRRFADAANARVRQLSAEHARMVLIAETEEARRRCS
jgi:hypothetical protein